MHVLVAEDDEGFGCVLGEYLQAAGARAEVIRDGQSALERAITVSPDVIVCDLNLPRLPGDALVARLRQSAPELVERVIFVTGEASGAPADGIGERFGRPCLVKPFELQALVDYVSGASTREAGEQPSPLGELGTPRITEH